MGVSPIQLFRLLVASVFMGMVMGSFYDILRISRVMLGMSRYTDVASAPIFCPHFYKPKRQKSRSQMMAIAKNTMLIVQDFLFCVTAGVVIALLLFSHNSGEFRGFVLVGVGVGFAIYYFTIGRLVIRASEYVVFAIKALFLYALYYLTFPFIALGRFIGRQIRNATRRMLARKRERRIAHYNKTTRQSMVHLAEGGFLREAFFQNNRIE